VLGRQGGPMTLTDIEVAARLQSCLLRFVTSGAPDTAELWPAFATADPCLTIFDRHFQILRDDNGQRARIWAELTH
jgi:para-nitrobenzyl esterase